MAQVPFVHLHCHTDYSLLDGACEITQLMELTKELGMPAIAMTDHGNLFGAVQFYDEAKKHGVHPVIGCEVYVSQQGHKTRSDSDRYNHLVLLCESQQGYQNLIQLVSTSFLEGFYYKPRIDKDLLSRHSQGLIAMSACLKGDISETILSERYEDARRLAHEYTDLFGKGNFFLEIQDHHLDKDRIVTPAIVRLAGETGIPLVATNDSHYLRKDDARAHEILLCIQTGKTMSDSGRMRFDQPEFYLKNRAEMMALFGEVEEAVNRPFDIAQRCHVKLEEIAEPFPRFDIPPAHTAETYFDYVARQGFEKRRGRLEAMAAAGRLKHSLPEYIERLDQEIRIIQQMNFSSYFLIVWDFIRFAKQNGIPVGPGRGSAAGSLVGYAMEITDIDPLQYGLLFERFLNPERISMPDIDIDFCTHRRGEVIRYVTEKYGRDQVAQIITFGTLGARAAIKDVARVLDLTFADGDRLTKMVPQVLNIKLKEAIKQEPNLAEAARKDARIHDVLSVAQRIEGLARNASVHAAGVVIAPQPLRELVPLYKTNKDEIVTQYDMKGLEKLSLLKMDFLGLTTLTIVHDTLELIKTTRGEEVKVEELSLDDAATYELFTQGHTSGVFQFESRGMRDILRRYRPTRIEDLIALNALYRPGPMQGGVVDDFIERKHGRRAVAYELPELKGLLEETYGVILYQEQVMQVANLIAGYTLGEADILRRAMGKKNIEEMARQRERFVSGALERKHPRKKVERLFELMEQFAGYGFNKSHSAAYAYLAYITGYLKAHYPVEFMAAVLTSETGNTAKVVKYINECGERKIQVLPPDVNFSAWNFSPEGQAIRFGLSAIKNVGQSAAESIMKARQQGGPFRSIYDFCERIDLNAVNRRSIESLIKGCALDSFEGNRPQLLAALEGAIEAGQRAHRDRESGQRGLFAAMFSSEDLAASSPPLPPLEDWSQEQKLAGEKEMLGIYVTGHPLDRYRDKVAELSSHQTDDLEGLQRGQPIRLCGVITGLLRRRNKEGKLWASFQVEDWYGQVEAVLFTTSYETAAPFLQEDAAVLVKGIALPEENAPPKISVQEIVPLELAQPQMPSLIAINVPIGKTNGDGADLPAELQSLFAAKPGETNVRLRLEKRGDFTVILDVPAKVTPDRGFRAEIDRLCGPGAIEEI